MTAAADDQRRPKSKTRTALFAYIAARLADVPQRSQSAFFETELRVDVSATDAERAARPRRLGSPLKRPRGRAVAAPTRSNPALRDWLLVDERALGLDLAIITIPGTGRRRTDLVSRLARLRGVRQIIETGHSRTLLVVTVLPTPVDRENIRAAVEEFEEAMVWDEVVFESHEPSIGTWRHLAETAAAADGLRR